MDKRDSDDFWKFVRMALPHGVFHLGVQLGARFNGDWYLVGGFDFTLPVIK